MRRTLPLAPLVLLVVPVFAALPPVTTSTVVGSPEPPRPYRAKRLYPNLRPSYPIHFKAIPGTDQVFFISEKGAYEQSTLWRITDTPDARTEQAVKVMDTPDPGVAYDLAFHPKFADNGYFYVGWNGKPTSGKTHFTKVTRFTMNPKPPYTVDLASATEIVGWESNGHNGGAVCFGPDGYLYVTSGDGTADSDQNNTGQRTDNLLCKVLRLDVDKPAEGKKYGIPADNPFVSDPKFAPETWAYGLRAPWRIAADAASGQVWVGNNGQDLWEMAHLIQKGGNYGWSVVEGSHPFRPNAKPGPTPILKPTVEHHHAEFRSLTGGLVARGKQLPDLDGAYVYGDYSTGRIWAIKHDGTKAEWHKELCDTTLTITAFGTNTRGELVICDHAPAGQGGFYTLEAVPAGASPVARFPTKLSESGLFASVKDHAMVPGVIPYAPNAPFWSDGLYKERYIVLPPGGKIGYQKTGGWDFPNRTVIVKSFATGDAKSRKWVETRFLTKQDDDWAGYSYRWNAAGTDAELVESAGADAKLANGQLWHYPSRAECMVCHTRASNYVLGLCELQMNRNFNYPTGKDNQVVYLDKHGCLNVTVPAAEGRPPFSPTTLEDPADATRTLDERARSWLHTNCAMCHQEAGGGNARIDLLYTTKLADMKLVNERPLHFDLGSPTAKLVVPGDPDASVLVKRISTRGPHQMPPVSSHVVDDAGVALVRQWIASLKR